MKKLEVKKTEIKLDSLKSFKADEIIDTKNIKGGDSIGPCTGTQTKNGCGASRDWLDEGCC